MKGTLLVISILLVYLTQCLGEYNHLMATSLFVATEAAVQPDLMGRQPNNFWTSFPRNVRNYGVLTAFDIPEFGQLDGPFKTIPGNTTGFPAWIGVSARVPNSLEGFPAQEGKPDAFYIVVAFAPADILLSSARATILSRQAVDYTVTPGCVDCKVHAGVQALYLSIAQEVVENLGTVITRIPFFGVDPSLVTKIFLVGHGLGGALATIAGLALKNDPSINQKLVVHTTGTPAFGNLALMDHINSQLPEYYRVTTAVDPVPHIPMDSFVHPRGEIYYPDSLSNIYTTCTDGPGQLDTACSVSKFATRPAALTADNLDLYFALPSHHHYLTEDGWLSYCGGKVPDKVAFLGCLFYDPTDPPQRAALRRVMQAEGDWTVVDRYTYNPVWVASSVRTKETQALEAMQCTVNDLKAFDALYSASVGSCRGRKVALRLLGPNGVNENPIAASQIVECFKYPERVSSQCSTYLGPSYASGTNGGTGFNAVQSRLTNLNDSTDLAVCLGESRAVLEGSPFSNSSCALFVQWGKAVSSAAGPLQLRCCTGKEARPILRDLGRFYVEMRKAKTSIPDATLRKSFIRCINVPDPLSAPCKAVLAAAVGQGLANSSTGLGPACQAAATAHPSLGSVGFLPCCTRGFQLLGFYQAFHSACTKATSNGDPSAEGEAPPLYTANLFGLSNIGNTILVLNQMGRCLGITGRTIGNSVNLFAGLPQVVGSGDNPRSTIVTCLLSADLASRPCVTAFLASLQGIGQSPDSLQAILADLVFGLQPDLNVFGSPALGKPSFCQCWTQAQSSLAALEGNGLGFSILGLPPGTELPGLSGMLNARCNEVVGTLRSKVAYSVLSSFSTLPASTTATSGSSPQGGIAAMSILSPAKSGQHADIPTQDSPAVQTIMKALGFADGKVRRNPLAALAEFNKRQQHQESRRRALSSTHGAGGVQDAVESELAGSWSLAALAAGTLLGSVVTVLITKRTRVYGA